MTPNDRSPSDPADADRAADARLQALLRSLPPPDAATDLGALNARVLAQWQERHGPVAHQADGAAAVAVLAARQGARAGWWITVSGLAAGLALGLGVWLQAPDPVLEDLLQPDVLSQMAVGEM